MSVQSTHCARSDTLTSVLVLISETVVLCRTKSHHTLVSCLQHQLREQKGEI